MHDDANSGAGIAAGDIIYCRGGTYTGVQHSVWTASGTSGNRITIQAHPGETPVFDGSSDGWTFLQIDGGDYITVDGLAFNNGFRYGVTIGTFSSESPATNIIIRNCSSTNLIRHNVYMSLGSEDVEIYNNYFKSGDKAEPNYEVSINAWHGTAAKPACQRAKIYNNIIVGFLRGISLASGARDIITHLEGRLLVTGGMMVREIIRKKLE